jgi:HTH-type transcriptional regulator/antitoxin MqsA
MKCPACGQAEMAAKTKDETLSYGGQSLTLHSMRGDFCTACDEGVWDEESYRRYIEAQSALVRAARGDIGGDIRRIRKSLKLTQAELSAVVGIGKVAFSRYERGETRPPGKSSTGQNRLFQVSSRSGWLRSHRRKASWTVSRSPSPWRQIS